MNRISIQIEHEPKKRIEPKYSRTFLMTSRLTKYSQILFRIPDIRFESNTGPIYYSNWIWIWNGYYKTNRIRIQIMYCSVQFGLFPLLVLISMHHNVNRCVIYLLSASCKLVWKIPSPTHNLPQDKKVYLLLELCSIGTFIQIPIHS